MEPEDMNYKLENTATALILIIAICLPALAI
jgi:hypothetical protein